MPILERIRRIAQANLTQWLNQAEAPEAEVEAKIRELESGALEAKNALANFAVTYKRLEKNVKDLQQACDMQQQRAEQALSEGDEAAARRALSEKLKASERIAQLTPVLESRRETYNELKDSLVEIHDQLNQTRAKLMDLRARKRAAEAEKALGQSLDQARAPGDSGFARLEESVMASESRVEVDREIRSDLSHEPLERSLRERRIDEELKSLQEKLSASTPEQ
ncbi:MAG: PspA/IM30 family protein [Kiritimatiellia bacterium]